MKLSKFGARFGRNAGIVDLMDDLGAALSGDQSVMMLGGGNPSHIPQVQAEFKRRVQTILNNSKQFEQLVGNYDSPQGDARFLTALADLFNKEYGWGLTENNIAITNGSQSAFFMLFNLFAGECPDGRHKHILLPMAPEYIGYADQGLTDHFFVAEQPRINKLDAHSFKYQVDFDKVTLTENTGAICFSRPTNPTGNVITDEEVEKIIALCRQHDVPLIIDNAYGTPFPNIIFTDANPIWNEHIILSMSLSKLGLPGVRSGILIANEEIIRSIVSANAIINLATGSFGPMLALDMVQSGQIIELSKNVIRPYYKEKSNEAIEWFHQALNGLDYYIHKPEGAIFLWLWFPNLSINSAQLYQRLKDRGVLIIPGHHFFPGLKTEWRHTQECMRVTYSQDREVVKKGIGIIAEEIKRAFDDGRS